MITCRLILPQQQAEEKNHERRTMSSAEHIAEDRAPNGVRPPSRLRQLAAASIGNAVEWYDWFSCTGAQAVYLSAPYLRLRRSERSCG
ncbi:hypothetical protein ACFW81_14130 [Streptomyces angustmyceticus]|uniref:hypothetical protein n=1 Tax=Streptomyces angustmyceticus TaxID=285578 RepID=UPI0036CD7E84